MLGSCRRCGNWGAKPHYACEFQLNTAAAGLIQLATSPNRRVDHDPDQADDLCHDIDSLDIIDGGIGRGAEPAYVPSTVNLRAAAGTGNEIVAKIPGGSLVDVIGCAEGWCEVEWQGKKGFSIATALDRSGRVPSARPAARWRRRGVPIGPGPAVIVDGPPIVVGGPLAVYAVSALYAYPVRYGYGPYWGYRRWRRW